MAADPDIRPNMLRKNGSTLDFLDWRHRPVTSPIMVYPYAKGRLIITRYVLALLLIALACVSSIFAQALPPNIVVILADDLGYGDVGFNGCPDIPTPNIDSLAANGVLCNNGYSSHPFCAPSRAGLLTGRYQQRFGFENNPGDEANNPRLGVSANELLLPQLLKPAGYFSEAVGKWHLGTATAFHPLERGFDSFFGFLGGESRYFNAHLLRDETPFVETDYLTDAFSQEAETFINSHATQPFFLYLAYNAVHTPYAATQAYLDRVAYITDPDRRLYAAMVVAMDDGVGGVLAALEANNLVENTLIVFLSDNGGVSQPFVRNYPLRGYKLDTLEGGIRVPFAVQWTGHLPANVIYDQPVSALDIVATAAAVAGVALPTDRAYDGLNLIPYLSGQQTAPERTLCWRWFGLGETGPPGSVDTIYAVRQGDLKLVTERAASSLPPALYDLSSDIGEATNLAPTQPNDVDTLMNSYDQWNVSTLPPLWQVATQFPSTLVMAGDWNNYDKDANAPPWRLTRVTAPGVDGTPDGFNWFKSTVHAAVAGGDTVPGMHSFALVALGSYANQWGGVTIKIDGRISLPYHSGTSLGPTNTISLEDGFYYSFRILDPLQLLGTSLNLSVMKTSAPPVTVRRSGQIPTTPTSNDPIRVKIVTNKAKSVEERLYLRWSTDTFITSHLVQASGSGVNYSATIPPQPGATLLQYCITTSTVDLRRYSTSGDIDSLVLATSGTYSVAISTPTPTPTSTPTPTITPTPTPTQAPHSITKQPADRTVRVGQAGKFTVTPTGTAPLRYQWTKNGTTIEEEATATHITPLDNGALFAVTVSNSVGSATLTVH